MPPTSIQQALRPPTGPLAVLHRIAEEGSALVVRLLAYLSGVAMLALIAADLVSMPAEPPTATAPIPRGWAAASRPHPAFAVNTSDFSNKTESYEILRHPEGGRRDTVRWIADTDRVPVAELEIYRAGGEIDVFADPGADLARRMGASGALAPQMAGLVETKFGKVTLWSLPGSNPACLGFAKAFDAPRMRISGWSCQAPDRATQRSLIGCTLDRLILLSAGNDPKLAELFAYAELRRSRCAATPSATADWVNSAEPPPLRGRL
jgi:hypothetical protein